MTIPKHENDDGRTLKYPDGTDFDDEMRFVHFDYIQNRYKNDRANAYLSIGDQLDLLYKDIIQIELLPLHMELWVDMDCLFLIKVHQVCMVLSAVLM